MNLGRLLLFSVAGILQVSSVSSGVSLGTLTNSAIYDASAIPECRDDAGRRIPLNITVSMKIREPRWSDYKMLTLRGVLEMRMKWKDTRLRHNASDDQDHISVHREDAIWTPDLVSLSPGGAFATLRSNYYRVYPDSSIIGEHEHSFKLQGTSSSYSFGFTFQILLFNEPYASGQPTLQWDEVDPLVVTEDEKDDSVEIQSFISDTCNIGRLTRWKSGAFSCLKIQIERKNKGITSSDIVSILLVYLPGALAVTLSCACLWTDMSFILGRGLVLVACLIHLYIQRASMNNDLLFVPNTETLILWLDWCTGFVFAIFLEVASVTFLKRGNYDKLEVTSGEERFPQARALQEEEEEGIVEDSAGETNTLCNHFHFPRIWLNRFPSTADAINAICRLVFPLCFMIFMSVFFSY